MTNGELEYEIANAGRLAFMTLTQPERDYLIYKKLKELEDYLFKIQEKLGIEI